MVKKCILESSLARKKNQAHEPSTKIKQKKIVLYITFLYKTYIHNRNNTSTRPVILTIAGERWSIADAAKIILISHIRTVIHFHINQIQECIRGEGGSGSTRNALIHFFAFISTTYVNLYKAILEIEIPKKCIHVYNFKKEYFLDFYI